MMGRVARPSMRAAVVMTYGPVAGTKTGRLVPSRFACAHVSGGRKTPRPT
jgi:hypothetical protein